jgi:glycosyltransferase involved in cell wall biosynthesis
MPDKKINVLYLSYDGLTDPLGQAQILPYLTGLTAKGYAITVISAEKPGNFDKRREQIEALVDGAGIAWNPVVYTKKPPVASTLWDLRKMYRLAVRLHQTEDFSIVHCRSYLTALTGLRLKKKHGLKFIFDMRGFWADERVEGGLWNLKSPVYKRIYAYFKRQERNFLLKADYTISLTHEAKQIIQGWPDLRTVPVQVIPCCADTALFKIPKKRKVKVLGYTGQHLDDYGWQGEAMPEAGSPDGHQALQYSDAPATPAYTLSYLGSIGTWYLLDEMLRFFGRLLFHQPEARFLFITPDDPQVIRKRADSLGISGKKIDIRQAERKEVPLLLAQSRFSLFFIRPSFSKKASSPTKMGEVLAMGLPVICNAGVGDTDYIIHKYQAGAITDAFTDEAFDQVIARMDDLLRLPPEHYRQAALEYFDLQKGVELYDQVYQSVL